MGQDTMNVAKPGWELADAEAGFKNMLQAAKVEGPQYIRASGGKFTLRWDDDIDPAQLGKFLAKGVRENP